MGGLRQMFDSHCIVTTRRVCFKNISFDCPINLIWRKKPLGIFYLLIRIDDLRLKTVLMCKRLFETCAVLGDEIVFLYFNRCFSWMEHWVWVY
jgi:hypothetical protein